MVEKRLFVPGSGLTPRHLAGRETERMALSEALADLLAGLAPTREIVLVGPRGNGKTTLLGWLSEKAKGGEKGEEAVEVAWLTPKRLETKEALYRRLIYSDETEAATARTTAKTGRAGAGGPVQVGGEFSSSRTEREEALPEFLPGALRRRRSSRALLVIVDEAHTMDPQIAGLLLNTSQEVRVAGLPFLLALVCCRANN